MVVGDMEMKVDLLVIGSGPGGYAAAFRGADLGLDVALVDRRRRPGGVCLQEGCIPSKTYLHLAEVIEETKRVSSMGLRFASPEINLAHVRSWKDKVVGRMIKGLEQLAEGRGIQMIRGTARFEGSNVVHLDGADISRLRFRHCIVATGSEPVRLPQCPTEHSGRIMTSREALDLADIPGNLLIVGGGYIGLEMGSIYAALGSKVHLVEVEDRLLRGIDADLVRPLQRRLQGLFARIDLQTSVSGMREEGDGVLVSLRKGGSSEELRFDRVLVAAGRRPLTDGLALDKTAVELDGRGAIRTDDGQRTADPAIFAVGDVTGSGMLAHTAMRQGRVAAENAAGQASAYDVRAVPAVVYTDPQIAWCGLTEEDALAAGIDVSVLRFPWKYSGRATTMEAGDGVTKIIADGKDGRILGVGMCGRQAEGLIAEGVLAVEMGATAEDLALCVHPHPTLSETIGEAAEIFLGSPTHLLPRKEKG